MRTRPARAAVAIGAMIAAAALAGCGAGQVTQTSEQVAAVQGASASVGQIAVRNAQFAFDGPIEGAAVHPAGGSAPLEMVIANTGAGPDRLVRVSSPIAADAQITGETEIPGGRTLVVEGAPAAPAQAPTTGAAPTAGATPTATTPSPTTPAGTRATTPAPVAATPTDVAASGERTASIVLTGLREDVQAGPTYPVVLTFERAGDVQVAVPVGFPSTPREDQHAE